MKELWDKVRYSEWFTILLYILAVLVVFVLFFVAGTVLNIWYIHFMKDTFGINVYWIINQ
ncbi:hypothetical protein E5351_00295 [Lactobacillus intestinalis]|uniref:Uncharacterized protein n=1 Tax=Lactobacillus intestinalis TaxID=151781 RepID=A0A4S2BTX0_9LACO|nr:hypothetical protein C821_001581 [Lactobacillus intestinalis]TGY17584.1 hypothetical protein E5351_00295 [Lactobacillus intestinalis]